MYELFFFLTFNINIAAYFRVKSCLNGITKNVCDYFKGRDILIVNDNTGKKEQIEVTQIATLLSSLFFVFNISFLPNYRVNSFVKW